MEVDERALARLFDATRETVAGDDLRAAQVAVALDGRLIGFETFGRAPFGGAAREATDATLFSIYSCTKAVTAAAAWILLQEGSIGLGDRVVDHVPEFGAHGKHAVTVEQLLTHTAGFPNAVFETTDWPDTTRRLARFASWELEWEPGTRFVYHGVAGMWVLAEILTRASRTDFRELIRTRICAPLELDDLFVGLPESELSRVADVVAVGAPPTEAERVVAPVDAPVVSGDDIAFANSAEKRIIGSPSGGGKSTAASLARFYQGLLGDARGQGPDIWTRTVLREAWKVRNPDFADPMTGHAALRGLGIVVAGGDDRMWRGFPANCSPEAFGHMGAAGQVAWADPQTGLAFAYLTNAADQNPVRQGAAGLHLSTLAAACVAS